MEGADFSGYATKAGLKCSDGRTINADAFKHMNGVKVPLVWQHGHNSAENVLGHAILEAREDGVYAYGFFNNTKQGENAKNLVLHGDIERLSIYANQLVERAKQVFHGFIREVSLVLSGANPGALIDYVRIEHGDGELQTLEDEAIIYTGLKLEHSDEVEHVDGMTVQDVYDSMTEEQKNVLHFMIGVALKDAGDKDVSQSDVKPDEKPADDKAEGNLVHQEGTEEMPRNVFEQNSSGGEGEKRTLSHADIKGIVADAVKGGSLKEAVEAYALKHGIENIDVLFPDAKAISDRPEFNKRRTEWVSGVINGTRKSPFSRVKSLVADLTFEAARAKGYIKGNFKKEEFFGVTKRVTTPTTVYKKQKLDRDDILDITDFEVVAWLKMEMRMMLEEELARAIMIGDGRAVDDEDKIKDPIGATEGAGIRSILHDHELYVTTVNVNIGDASSSYVEVIEAIQRHRQYYKGTGTPTFYTTEAHLVEMLLVKDTTGRRLYANEQDLAAALRVSSVVAVEVFEDETDLVGIIVNLNDYNIGADKGGEITLFDDFDIDYNQYKYLMETRISGALTKIKAALVIKKTASANVLVTPNSPTFNETTGVVTIVATTGVVYKNEDTSATLSTGAQAALDLDDVLNVLAVPASGYYFANNAEDEWSFTGVTEL